MARLDLGLGLQGREDAVDAALKDPATVFLRTLGMRPRNDSAERANVPPSIGSKWNMWTAWTPIVSPVQPISRGASTTWRVDLKVAEPDLQRNLEPGSSGPWNDIDVTSEFHVGHPERSDITAQTVSGGASISI
jgi:hypothetical protein